MARMSLVFDYKGEVTIEKVKVGDLVWHHHSGTDFEVPFSQEIKVSDDTLSVTLVGLQYIDFSDFLLLVEVQPTGQLFMVDVPDTFVGSEFGVFEMVEVEDFKEFHSIVGERLKNHFVL